MKTANYLFVGSLLISIASYVGGNSSIKTFTDLAGVQNFFGLLGVIGGCIVAFVAKSPVTFSSSLAKITGNGVEKLPTPLPKDVN